MISLKTFTLKQTDLKNLCKWHKRLLILKLVSNNEYGLVESFHFQSVENSLEINIENTICIVSVGCLEDIIGGHVSCMIRSCKYSMPRTWRIW
jgi:hypothetical protein